MKAEDYFHKPPYNYNCAQTILKIYQQEYAVSENIIEQFKVNGGGRAEKGICGALYSVLYLTRQNSSNIRKDIQDKFTQQAGSMYCEIIKQNKKTTCLQCINIASQLLKEFLTNSPIHN